MLEQVATGLKGFSGAGTGLCGVCHPRFQHMVARIGPHISTVFGVSPLTRAQSIHLVGSGSFDLATVGRTGEGIELRRMCLLDPPPGVSIIVCDF